MRSFTIAAMALWALLCVSAAPSKAEEISPPPISGRESHEGSSLLRVENAALVEANGWKRAFWVAFDEGKAGSPLGLLGQTSAGEWQLREVPLTDGADRPEIDDAEALARQGDFIYLIGSHFGKKKRKLEAVRQFVARFRESAVQGTSPKIDLEVRRDNFELHRLLNDAITQHHVDLIDRGSKEKEEYIEKTRTSGEPGKENVRENDRALNIEGATFLESGHLALGLRYPVTKQGEPLILVLADADVLFQEKLPKVVAVWALRDAGTPSQLRGIRALDSAGGEIHAIVGSIERFPSESPILQDHTGAGQVTAEHRVFPVPALDAQVAESRRVRDLAPALNVEGVSVDDCSDWYLFDEVERVRVRHEPHP